MPCKTACCKFGRATSFCWRSSGTMLRSPAKVGKHRSSAIDVTRQIDLGNVACLQLPGWGKLLVRWSRSLLASFCFKLSSARIQHKTQIISAIRNCSPQSRTKTQRSLRTVWRIPNWLRASGLDSPLAQAVLHFALCGICHLVDFRRLEADQDIALLRKPENPVSKQSVLKQESLKQVSTRW